MEHTDTLIAALADRARFLAAEYVATTRLGLTHLAERWAERIDRCLEAAVYLDSQSIVAHAERYITSELDEVDGYREARYLQD